MWFKEKKNTENEIIKVKTYLPSQYSYTFIIDINYDL